MYGPPPLLLLTPRVRERTESLAGLVPLVVAVGLIVLVILLLVPLIQARLAEVD